MSQPNPATRASVHSEVGRSNGLSLIFWLLEQPFWVLIAIPTTFAALICLAFGGSWLAFVLAWLAIPLFLVVFPLIGLIRASRTHDAGSADWSRWFTWKDPQKGTAFQGKKIPMERLYEAYMAGELDFKGDVYDTMLHRNEFAQFCFTSNDIKFYVQEFLRQNLGHSVEADHGDIAHVYNRGNDFYNWFLDEPMVYTSGIFRSEDEALADAQRRKLDTVCQYVQMKPGDKHLDIGCGWGPLIVHSAKQFGTQATGVTLAKEQAEWGYDLAEKAGVRDKVNIIVDDYRNIPDEKWDKITCLEMAEHVGIKNFQKFLLQVRHMLKDDGIFYLQIAGLRRPWQYEDLVWGLFMGKYIFPGADASCPLGFVVNQVERAGFEVHRVENCGVHYSLTIKRWYENWKKNEAAITAKYGQRWFRMWMMFLAWSTIIAAQGSSTVFMITMTKNIKNDKDSVASEEAKKVPFSRMKRWVGKNPVATQQ
ncbi:MAG: class I SAM-dependent methyltransferase [Myxococcales bacterium]|nr:class I SAM-dependent methyltransferase [Myxococcales bacterium]